MKAAIQDAATLRALKPLELAAYLRAKGWRQQPEFERKSSLWLNENDTGEEVDIFLPLNRDVADYALRISEALRTLASVEKRSQLDVMNDLLTFSVDLIRVRAPGAALENGSLPIDQAVAFVERARDLILAAACAAINKRGCFATRKPTLAMEYMNRVRMGQTERGSFVLTILSPVTPKLSPGEEQLRLPSIPEPDPYERQVTLTLIDALTALEDAAGRAAVSGQMKPFEDAVSRGVSANLCYAVKGLSEISDADGLDIRVSWSPSRPVDEKTPSLVTFSADRIPSIAEAGRMFKETAPAEDYDIEGVVTKLSRGIEASDGDVAITGYVDGRLRKIAVHLESDAYGKAIRAHEERQTVSCTGDLVKIGRGYRLQSPRHFRIDTDSNEAGF